MTRVLVCHRHHAVVILANNSNGIQQTTVTLLSKNNSTIFQQQNLCSKLSYDISIDTVLERTIYMYGHCYEDFNNSAFWGINDFHCYFLDNDSFMLLNNTLTHLF